MKDVKDYTTEELERLTTLTPVTARVGEYVLGAGVVQLRTKDRVVCSDGSSDTPRAYHWVERRVHSFANHTELDPPQAEMLAELGRRKQPVFQVGDVVVDVSAFQRGTLVVTRCPDMSAEWYSCVDGYGHKWAKEPKELRPATDAEIAAYHKAHCVSKAQPEVVSNATHAGRRVRTTWGRKGIIVDMDVKAAFDLKWPTTAGDEVAWIGDDGTAYVSDVFSLELLHD